MDRSCPQKLPVGIIHIFFPCRRPLVSQDLNPPALVENNCCYGICFVKFKATHTKRTQFERGVGRPLHTGQTSLSIWTVLSNLHFRPFCSVNFGLAPNINNYPALMSPMFSYHSSYQCAMRSMQVSIPN